MLGKRKASKGETVMKNFLDRENIEFLMRGTEDKETLRKKILYMIERKNAISLQDMVGRPSIALSSGALGRVDYPRF